MVDASLVNTVQTIGILVGIAIALWQIRDMNKTRSAELYLRLWERWNTKEFSEQRYEVYRMEWTDLDDFREKYNTTNNPETFASWNTFGRTINGVAELKRKNLIDIDFLDEEMIIDILTWWGKFGQLEKERWEKGRPAWGGHFPFIKEIVDSDRRTRSWLYDEETGDLKIPPEYRERGIRWIKPEEIEQMRIKLYK